SGGKGEDLRAVRSRHIGPAHPQRRSWSRAVDRVGHRSGPWWSGRPSRNRRWRRHVLDVPADQRRRHHGSKGEVMARILIVEDEERIVSFLTKGLEANGHSTMAVGDGTTAAAVASDDDFDLMILDIGLPGQDGFAV